MIAQLVGFAFTPVLTRIFPPDTYGMLAIFTTLSALIGVVTCLRYELAIVLPKDDRQAANLLAICLCLAVLAASTTAAFIVWGKPWLLRILNAPELGSYLGLLPWVVVSNGALMALTYWNTRARRFARLGVNRVANVLAIQTPKVVLGFSGQPTGGTMIGSTVAGTAATAGLLGVQTWFSDGRFILQSVSPKQMREELIRYRKFPMFDIWSGLLNSVSLQLPVLMLSAFCPAAAIGFYALGNRAVQIPIGIVGSSIGSVFFQWAAQSKHSGSLPDMVQGTFKRMLLWTSFPFLLLALIGPELFGVLFGKEWSEAGVIVQILAPSLFFMLLGSPISSLIPILGRQEISLAFNAMHLVTRAAALWIGARQGSMHLALVLLSASGVVVWNAFCAYLISHAGVRPASFFRLVIRELLFAFAFTIPVIAAKWLPGLPSISVILAGALSAVAYYAVVILKDKPVREFLTSRFSKR